MASTLNGAATRRAATHRAPRGPRSLHRDHAATQNAHTIHTAYVAAADTGRALMSGASNRKIGREVLAGRWKGFPIYTLTLEERATCPRSCHNWSSCYGNGMPFARRLAPGPALIETLERELAVLDATTGGFVVRLHVLGDFYSVEYVHQWAIWLGRFPRLNAFGYTAWPADTEIGRAIRELREFHWDRFAIRQSVPHPHEFRREAVAMWPDPLPIEAEKLVGGFICPAQRKAEKYCGNCAACWESDKNVVFLLHGR